MTSRDVKIISEMLDEADFEALLDALKSHGFEQSSTFQELGLIFGRVSDERVDNLAKLPGIMAVKDENVFKAISSPPSEEASAALGVSLGDEEITKSPKNERDKDDEE